MGQFLSAIRSKFGNRHFGAEIPRKEMILIPNETLVDVISFLDRPQLGSTFSLIDRRHHALSHPKMHELGPHWLEQIFLCGLNAQKMAIFIKKGSGWICLPFFPNSPLPDRILGFRTILLKEEINDQMIDFLRIHAKGAQLQIEEILELYKYDVDKAEHFLPEKAKPMFSLFPGLRIGNFVGHFLISDLLDRPQIRRIEWLQMARWDDALVDWLLQNDGRCRKMVVQEWNSFGDFPPEFHNATVKDLCFDSSECRFVVKFCNDSRFPVSEEMNFTNAVNGECIRSIPSIDSVFVVRHGQNGQMTREDLEAIFGDNEEEKCSRVIAGQRNGNGCPMKISFARH